MNKFCYIMQSIPVIILTILLLALLTILNFVDGTVYANVIGIVFPLFISILIFILEDIDYRYKSSVIVHVSYTIIEAELFILFTHSFYNLLP